MHYSVRNLKGYTIGATDGDIGRWMISILRMIFGPSLQMAEVLGTVSRRPVSSAYRHEKGLGSTRYPNRDGAVQAMIAPNYVGRHTGYGTDLEVQMAKES